MKKLIYIYTSSLSPVQKRIVLLMIKLQYWKISKVITISIRHIKE